MAEEPSYQQLQQLILAHDMADHDTATALQSAARELVEVEVAKRLLAAGFTPERIAQVLGLSLERIQQLQRD
jgi:hypothetical protein